jgi:transposase
LRRKDARRPSREREALVGECTRLINRMKRALARLGVCDFNLNLRKAPQRLAGLRTPEGMMLPPNTLASCAATCPVCNW